MAAGWWPTFFDEGQQQAYLGDNVWPVCDSCASSPLFIYEDELELTTKGACDLLTQPRSRAMGVDYRV